ncbi:MAG TPA: hypothetical protein VHE61_12730 [Opitutaceae bacterium]|nr:hypothetical protein [Opitutaceae bacterium]
MLNMHISACPRQSVRAAGAVFELLDAKLESGFDFAGQGFSVEDQGRHKE